MTDAVKVKREESPGGQGTSFQAPEPVKKLVDYPRRFRQFLHEVRAELRNVTWPTPADVRSTTVVVIATVIFFGVFLFLVDKGASMMVERVFRIFKP